MLKLCESCQRNEDLINMTLDIREKLRINDLAYERGKEAGKREILRMLKLLLVELDRR